MNNILDNKQNVKFGLLRRFRDERFFSINFAISEFIDNSISSFENNKDNSNLTKTRNIYILYFQDEKKYWIIDNAFGIDDLQDAMKIYNYTFNKTNTSKNQYGYGMKSAIFYLGRWGTIYTKCPNKDYYEKGEYVPDGNEINYKTLEDEDIDNRDVIYNVTKLEKNQIDERITKVIEYGGTCIEIDDVYSHRGLNTTKNIDNLLAFLGFRFSNYINRKFETAINITIKTCDKGKEIFSELVTENDVFKNAVRISEIDKKWVDYKINYDNMLKNEQEYNRDDLKEYYDKLFNNDPLIFDDVKIPITASDGQEYSINAKICFICPSSKKDKIINNCRGLSIIHSKRYICHPGATDDETNLYNFQLKDKDCDGYWRWLYGEIILENFPTNTNCEYIYPEKNKRSINFHITSPITQDDFKDALKNYLIHVYPFLKFLVHINKNNENNNQFRSDIDKSQNKTFLAKRLTYDAANEIAKIDDNSTLSKLGQIEETANVFIKPINDAKKPTIEVEKDNNGNICYLCNESLYWTNDETFKTNIKMLLVYIDYALKSGMKFSSVQELLDYIFEKIK